MAWSEPKAANPACSAQRVSQMIPKNGKRIPSQFLVCQAPIRTPQDNPMERLLTASLLAITKREKRKASRSTRAPMLPRCLPPPKSRPPLVRRKPECHGKCCCENCLTGIRIPNRALLRLLSIPASPTLRSPLLRTKVAIRYVDDADAVPSGGARPRKGDKRQQISANRCLGNQPMPCFQIPPDLPGWRLRMVPMNVFLSASTSRLSTTSSKHIWITRL